MSSPYQQTMGGQPHLPPHHQYPVTQGLAMGSIGGTSQPILPGGVADGQGGIGEGGVTVGGSQPSQPHRDFNMALLCRVGQETVQEIVGKTTELFQILKGLQPPTVTPQSVGGQEERKVKLQDSLKLIGISFKRLRRIYEKCNENCAGMEYTHIESLVPMKDEVDPRQEDRKVTETVKFLTEEHRELVEQVMLKNRQLKEVIDNLRSFIWDINTMLAVRKP